MQSVTFGIDKDMNLVIQFPVFIQPYMQRPLILCQLQTVPVPVLDENIEAHSYTHLKVRKPNKALNSETFISLTHQELRSCKKIGNEFYCEELFVVKHKSSYRQIGPMTNTLFVILTIISQSRSQVILMFWLIEVFHAIAG